MFFVIFLFVIFQFVVNNDQFSSKSKKVVSRLSLDEF